MCENALYGYSEECSKDYSKHLHSVQSIKTCYVCGWQAAIVAELKPKCEYVIIW